MKHWVLIAVAGVAGYATFKWYQNHKQQGGFLSMVGLPGGTNAGPYNDIAGVPVFDSTAITNKPDQIAATLHANDASTLDGSFMYQPAFGPNANREGGLPVF